MKNLRTIFATAIIALLAIQASAQVHVSGSVFASIPIAPNINLNIGVMTPQPRFDAIWIEGYWTFDHRTRSYVWVQGFWTTPPHPGAIWIPGFWNNTGHGFVWVNAAWTPRNSAVPFGYFNGRYDYYGRPVYYSKPTRNIGHGYAFRYDHRSEFRSNRFSSDPRQNNERSGRTTTSNGNNHNYNNGRSSGNFGNNRTSTTPSRGESVTPSRGGNNNNTRTSTSNTTSNRNSSTPATSVNTSSSRGSSQGNVKSSESSSRRGTTTSPSSTRSSRSDSGSSSSSRSRSSETPSSSRR